MTHTSPPAPRAILAYVGIGLAAGLLSGLFGVGGGTVIVPMLVMLLAYDQRRAAGTSLAAIVPTAIVGVISYAAHDAVAWLPAAILAIGSVIGAQIGSALLARTSQTVLRWCFSGFLLVIIASLFFVVPSRDAGLELTGGSIAGLIGLGLFTGVLAALLGVGGGVVIVPVLMLAFGTSDLLAKGTSLLVMIPTAISGTIGNLRRGNVDLLAGVVVGVAAGTTTALGTWVATLLEPRTANILFAAFLIYVAVQMMTKAVRGRKKS